MYTLAWAFLFAPHASGSRPPGYGFPSEAAPAVGDPKVPDLLHPSQESRDDERSVDSETVGLRDDKVLRFGCYDH